MEIYNLSANNIQNLSTEIELGKSLVIAGLSGSGKSTFAQVISDELNKRLVTLLPKSEYSFLFPELLKNNVTAVNIKKLNHTIYLKKKSYSDNPRSTIGTYSGIFKEIRQKFGQKYNLPSDYFSYNNPLSWCLTCRGRGVLRGEICHNCQGERYREDIKNYVIEKNNVKYNIVDINQLPIDDLLLCSEQLGLSKIHIHIINNMNMANISYLSLDRAMNTLSGGELTRVYLCDFLANCSNINIIIDELSIGLDTNSLYNLIDQVNTLGKCNNIWLIDHSDIVINSATSAIYFGLGSGPKGGKLVSDSPRVAEKCYPLNLENPQKYYDLNHLKFRNLDIDKINLPKNRVIAITGESGCGKSTLINHCLKNSFLANYPNVKVCHLAQAKSKSITSLSSVATFLDLKKIIKKLEVNLSISISDLISKINIEELDKDALAKIKAISSMGLDYLTLDQKINSLSTGEFQAINLIKSVYISSNEERVIILDEPSQGLSQNILNSFMLYIKELVKNKDTTILMIEHNEYFLKNSEYILDFGKRTTSIVTAIPLLTNADYYSKVDKNQIRNLPKIASNIEQGSGIQVIEEDYNEVYSRAKTKFYGGYLRKLSQTASWIYDSYKSDRIEPILTINLENHLYSQDTFLFESHRILDRLISISDCSTHPDIKKFNFQDKNNLCRCCKGKGYVRSFDFNIILSKKEKGFFGGLIDPNVMKALKSYNYDKFKLMFSQVEEYSGLKLDNPYSKMSQKEISALWYGFWENEFFDKTTKTKRYWQGLVHLIIKYIKINDFPELKKSITSIGCPHCQSGLLHHKEQMTVFGSDIRGWLKKPLHFLYDVHGFNVELIDDISAICDMNTSLNFDISTLPISMQVQLKLIELKHLDLSGFNIYIKNYYPFSDCCDKIIADIAKNNKIYICDNAEYRLTKKELIKKIEKTLKVKKKTLIYELFGYKKISTQINSIREKEPCIHCNGKKFFKIEGLDENIPVINQPCESCFSTGISDKGLSKKIMDTKLLTLLTGNVSKLGLKHSGIEDVAHIPLNNSLDGLNKENLYKLFNFLNHEVNTK